MMLVTGYIHSPAGLAVGVGSEEAAVAKSYGKELFMSLTSEGGGSAI